MTEPLSLDVVLSEFDPTDEAWVLQDSQSGLYVIVPDPKYPGRKIIRFFMSEQDAMDVLNEIVKTGNEKIPKLGIEAKKVNLHKSIRSIAATRKPGYADGFVVHSPNEVFEFLWPKP